MGQEITHTYFSDEDFAAFQVKLEEETATLREWFSNSHFKSDHYICGLELEAWLVDNTAQPSPTNDTFLQTAPTNLVTPELSKFNIELNSTPEVIKNNVFSLIHNELDSTWGLCEGNAQKEFAHVMMIGILPTIKEEQFSLENISRLKRYFAMNRQIVKIREGRPIHIDIKGKDHLQLTHQDIMLEAATTSLQVHLQVKAENAVRFFNSSQIISAPIVAVAANSPYLFGKQLWDETRIALFEQAVPISSFQHDSGNKIRRVTFGTGYINNSLMELFEENLSDYPVLLPEILDTQTPLPNLRLHNGTIWRWNRPLIGFNGNDSGQATIRIEHRAPSAGPTVIDTIANIVFYVGLSHYYATQDTPPETQLDFQQAKNNFYEAAQHGLDSTIIWLEGKELRMSELIIQILLPAAQKGLEQLHVDSKEIKTYLGIIEQRVMQQQNGANWQKAYIAKHGNDFDAMAQAYLYRQQEGLPVHEWKL